MSSPELQRNQLIEGYARAHAPSERWLVGGEFERAVVHADGSHVSYEEPYGVRWLLESMAVQGGWEIKREGEYPIELRRNGATITIEPGAQVELSGRPHRRIVDLRDELYQNRADLLALSAGKDHHWISTGLTPLASIESVGWVPKGRYRVMREMLPQHGDRAQWMMKGTCSVQANFDFASEADARDKVYVGASLGPLITASFANSPLYQGQPNGFQSYRAHIWTRTDPARCGFPRPLTEGYSHEAWVDWLLDVPMMFRKLEGAWQSGGWQTFRTWMTDGIDGRFPTWSDWELHQTSVFPDVRVKRTIELRCADGVDAPLAVAFCALWTGLLYDDAARREAAALAKEWRRHGSLVELHAIAGKDGVLGTVGGRSVAAWLKDLAPIAVAGLGRWSPVDVPLLDPWLELVAAGRSPSLGVLERWKQDPRPASVLASVAM